MKLREELVVSTDSWGYLRNACRAPCKAAMILHHDALKPPAPNVAFERPAR